VGEGGADEGLARRSLAPRCPRHFPPRTAGGLERLFRLPPLLVDERVPRRPGAPQSTGNHEAGPVAFPASPGATDGAGETQTAERTDIAPNGASGHHTVQVDVT